jgi:hypothetical protein
VLWRREPNSQLLGAQAKSSSFQTVGLIKLSPNRKKLNSNFKHSQTLLALKLTSFSRLQSANPRLSPSTLILQLSMLL